MIREEIYREQEINGQRFEFHKDTQYSHWTIKSGGYVYPSKYTTYPRAVEAAKQVVETKIKRRKKEA